MKRQSRFLAMVITLCMVLSMLPLTALAASLSFKDKYGTWEYVEEADGTITITGFTATRTNIVVPGIIDGRPVKKLGDGLFRNHNDLKIIEVSEGIEAIGANAFSGCEQLKQVKLPESLTSIGDGAFSKPCPSGCGRRILCGYFYFA